jgi:hypothetical protein
MKLSWTRTSLAIVGIGAVATTLGWPFLSSLGSAVVFFGLLSILRISDAEHWRVVNVMLRLGGFWFALGGLGFLAWGIYFYAAPGSGVEEGGSWWVFAGVGVFALAVGTSLLTRRAYRPDLGDQALSDQTRRWLAIYPPAYLPQPIPDPNERRTWWAGDRIAS